MIRIRKMIRFIADNQGKIIGNEKAIPICGEDFCDDCGDCLICYIEDPCSGGSHRWIRYQKGKEL